MAALPLTGLTVVAVEQAVAAPFCTSRLADAGARVIKIERPEGDFARGYDKVAAGQSSYFVWLNRGKESVVLNLACETGREAFLQLVASADVLVQNLKPGALKRLGLAPETLRGQYPRLITCSISGYGDKGPMASRKAYDLLIQAEAGLASLTGGPQEPARVGISIVDIATGATAHAAILEALIGRSVTGRGADIRLSMFDVMADWLAVPLLHHEGGASPKRSGLAHPSIAPYGAFSTADGQSILLSIQSEREWAAFASHLLEKPDLMSDPRFANNVLRVANRSATDKLVADAFAQLTGEEVRRRLAAGDIAFASVNDMAALAAHPHLRRITVETPGGAVFLPAPGPMVDGEVRCYGPVPGLGDMIQRQER